jgi:ABC-2 type transport system permease protein
MDEAVSTGFLRSGLIPLLRPKLRGKVNRALQGGGGVLRLALLGGAALGFWALLFVVIHRMLLHFRGAEGIGDLMAGKLLGIAFLTFLLILLLSNIITALSTFFLARDLELLASSPADPVEVYGARLVESLINSSWMVVLLAVPLVAAYGVVYGAGPLFYLMAAGVVGAFLVLPAVVGAALTLLLVNIFPARRTRDLLALIGLFAAAGVVVLVRVLQPERLVRPEEFRSVVDFMAVLRTPSSPWIPSEWASAALLSWLRGSWDPFPFLLLASTAAAFVVMGAWLHGRFFAAGFSRALEGAERQEGRVRPRRWEWVLRRGSPTVRELVTKEVRVFFRDTTQWSQLILLAVLVVVYVYNIRVLPVGRSEEISFFLVHLVGFLNLGLAGFVVAAVAARFVFPAMSLEGRMTWLLRSSPLEPRTLFWTKYMVGSVPLLAIAVPLIVGTNLLLQVSPLLMTLSTLSMVGATLAMTAMALAFGAIFPNYETENPAEIPTSFGGLLFMMASVAYLVLLVGLTGWPMYHLLRARFQGVPFIDAGWGALALGSGGALLMTGGIVVLSLQAGIRRYERSELLLAE